MGVGFLDVASRRHPVGVTFAVSSQFGFGVLLDGLLAPLLHFVVAGDVHLFDVRGPDIFWAMLLGA